MSEPVALKLRRKSGNIYLDAQIYTGFMYMGAALCMWLLRAWKIGELQAIAAAQEKRPEEIDAVATDQREIERMTSAVPYQPRSPLVKRLLMWKKV